MKKRSTKTHWTGGYLRLGFAAAILALTGCASAPTRVDTGAIRAHTYNFCDARPADAPPFTEKEAAVHEVIQDTIRKNLAAKGLTEVPKNGDVTVAYLIIISDGGKTVTYNDFYGYGGPADVFQTKAHKAFTIQNKNRTQYDAGTLVIDVADYREYRVFWRNYVYSPILNDLPIDQRKQRLRNAVDKTLSSLRVAR